jgi:purine-binding chemotaxis protein CheW
MDDVARQLVVFKLSDRCYALHLSAVQRVLRIAEIAPLPKAPAIVMGIVNVQGCITPVFDLRRRFGLPHRPIDLSDHLIVAGACRRVVAVVADAVVGVVQRLQAEITAADQVFHNLQYLEGVARLDDGLIMIHDLDTFLSPGEEQTLEQALALV